MRRLVMFVLPLLCSGALVFGLATSLRKISNQSHDSLHSTRNRGFMCRTRI